jgi:8-amino-3,8-dideoxy-alpha-D-manno-octulosonate transaminase
MPGYELIGKEERQAINELFDDGGVLFAHGFDNIRNGRYRVREFERAFADYLGVKYAQAVSSGTAAIKVALVALGIKPGDEVITQAFTFVATVEAIVDIGAVPVIVNINDTFNMDPVELEKAITLRTKAIIPVHMLGVAAELDKILPIAKKYNIPVLDDNCESLGADWNNEKLGIQSDICTWSFDAGKVIIAGEGGMITTDNEELYLMARGYSDHGHESNPNFPRGRDTHRIYGFNYRMTELQAAIGLAQLKKLDYIVETNRRNYQIYFERLQELNGLAFRQIPGKCTPLCDCLIFSFQEIALAEEYVRLISENGLGTKNVPDAIEWHFARYWDHIFSKFGFKKEQLHEHTVPSAKLLERSVAIPIMVKTSIDQLYKNAELIQEIAKQVL